MNRFESRVAQPPRGVRPASAGVVLERYRRIPGSSTESRKTRHLARCESKALNEAHRRGTDHISSVKNASERPRAPPEKKLCSTGHESAQAVTAPETQRRQRARASAALPTMALSERSLRDLRKIADLDAKTEAAQAAKEVADRRATALQDALAERAGRIAALERACRLPAGEDDDGAAAALEAAAEAAERDAVAAELAAAADARRAAEDRAAAATSRSESAESRVASAALEARLASLQRDAMATAQSEGGAARRRRRRPPTRPPRPPPTREPSPSRRRRRRVSSGKSPTCATD